MSVTWLIHHCNTLQPTATHCNPLQPTATHCNTLQHTATHCNPLQHTATYCNTLQHTATGLVLATIASVEDSDLVPKCLDYGISNNVVYLVLEYFDGTPLDQVRGRDVSGAR